MTAGKPAPRSDADWQRANAKYLQCHLDRIRLLLERRTLWLRSRWSSAERQDRDSDPLDSKVIRDETVDRLFRSESPGDAAGFFHEGPARELSEAIERMQAELAAQSEGLATQGRPASFDVLCTVFNLNPFERDVLMLCAGVSIDPALARICAYVNDDVGLNFATVPLALSLFCLHEDHVLAGRRAFTPEATLRRYSLVTAQSRTGALHVDDRVVDYLHGNNRFDERIAELWQPMPAFPEVPCQTELAVQLEECLRHPAARKWWQGVNLFGPPGSGRRALARAVCDRLRLNLYKLDVSRLPAPGTERQEILRLMAREAILSQSTPYIDVPEPDSGEREMRQIEDVIERMPVFFVVGSRTRLSTNRQMLSVAMPHIDTANRLQLWNRALESAGVSMNGDLGQVVEQFHFPPEMVSQAITAAGVRAHLRNGGAGSRFSPEDLWEACREQTSWKLSQFARPIAPVFSWDDIVLPEETLKQLHEIAAQVRQRARVYYDWGFGEKLVRGRGVSALFAGVSGAGKTMAAEVLAKHLRLDLYRIDLAGVVSKYIGESEKNLRKVFDAAERSGAILFFDEADALFGRRTEVKDSHDRFANIEVDYLLQRMEDYRGLSILATNRKNEVDRAFLRRLRFLVDFPFPDASQRLQIWRRVFPPQTPLGDLDYEMLSRMEIAGGNIRNIALAAAFLAAQAGEDVEMRHLIHAARREYIKMDKMIADAEFHRRSAHPARR